MNTVKGMLAGFVATIVVSALMLTKSAMGLIPELNIILMLTDLVGLRTPAAGWLVHFAIGTVMWGGLFAWFNPRLPGKSYVMRGIAFAFSVWLLMMLVFMPIAGAGLFATRLGIMAPTMTLMLHLIFGAVLGAIYSYERPAAVHV